MPIINKNNRMHLEYTIPEDIDKKIPEYFYHAMAGEIISCFGWDGFPNFEEFDNADGNIVGEGYYELCSSTSGWLAAFFATCKKLDMMWLYDYWNQLEWYDSDVFDGIIESRIVEKHICSEENPANSYYKKILSEIESYVHKRDERKA